VFKRGRTTVAVLTAAAGLAAVAGGVIILLPHGPAKAASTGASQLVKVLQVTAVTPAPGANDVNGAAPIRLTLASDVAPDAPLPHLSPAVPGSWQRTGTSLVFTPATGFRPQTHVTITVPGQAWTDSYTTGTYSLLRLQQLLSQLGYLPLSWAASPATNVTAHSSEKSHGITPDSAITPNSTATPVSTATPASTATSIRTATSVRTATAASGVNPGNASAQLSAAYQPPAGSFTMQHGYPASLGGFWHPGQMNLVTTGAIMAFESQHGMQLDGLASPAVWTALLHAAADQDTNTTGYTYAIASKVAPESLTIWHDGRQVFRSYANTGIPIDPTADGTFPVYLRYRFQVMQGTNPDGSHYADPVEWVSYFHEGEAVHYFPRYSYGWPQSLGCVELPYTAAEQAWPYLTYGSLVTVAQ
jgi:L,D-transpeptidase catalytic domain